MARLPSHAASEGNAEHYQLLGRLNAAWNTLDYVLRLALKRKRGISINSADSDEIFGQYSHGTLIDTLKTEFIGDSALTAELSKVGKSRDQGLYGRRNQYIHALWAEDSAGRAFHQRIGAKDWREPVSFRKEDIEALIGEIEKTADSIETITHPKL